MNTLLCEEGWVVLCQSLSACRWFKKEKETLQKPHFVIGAMQQRCYQSTQQTKHILPIVSRQITFLRYVKVWSENTLKLVHLYATIEWSKQKSEHLSENCWNYYVLWVSKLLLSGDMAKMRAIYVRCWQNTMMLYMITHKMSTNNPCTKRTNRHMWEYSG